MAKQETNIQFVKNLMEQSNYGPLAQLFVIDAIAKFADKVATADPKDAESALVSGEAWIGVAKEIKSKIDGRMK